MGMVVRVVWVCHLQALAALFWPETDGGPSCLGVSFASSGGPVLARNRWWSELSGCLICKLWRPCFGQKQMVVRVVWVCHLQALAALFWPETDGGPSCLGVSLASSGGPVLARNRWWSELSGCVTCKL